MAHHTKDKGDIAVTQAIADLTLKGYAILTPTVSEHLPFDFIAYKDGKIFRIQSKYSSDGTAVSKTSWNDKNGNHSKKYNENDFDYYALYLPQIKKVIYPSIKFAGLSFRVDIPNAANPFYWYEDFLDFTDNAQKKTYKDFGIELTHSKTQAVIDGCIKRRKVDRPSKEELTKMLWEKPTLQIAKDFGVSDKAIEKWAKAYGIVKPARGYWAKKAKENKSKE